DVATYVAQRLRVAGIEVIDSAPQQTIEVLGAERRRNAVGDHGTIAQRAHRVDAGRLRRLFDAQREQAALVAQDLADDVSSRFRERFTEAGDELLAIDAAKERLLRGRCERQIAKESVEALVEARLVFTRLCERELERVAQEPHVLDADALEHGAGI